MNIAQALDPVVTLKTYFPDVIQEVIEFRDEVTIVIDSEQIVRVMQFLRDTTGLIYNFLSDISAVDYYPDYGHRPGRFAVAYHLYSLLYNRRLRIKAYVQEESPSLPTIIQIWPAANWLEREIMDMMGIIFEGHPDPRRLLMPDDWNGHPHRRDYPLGYETIQFSFNVEEIMKHKVKGQK
ncbi:MAG: NADH-quinone oxidoreductase subunit C [Anaerolineae bacterium]|jgi:NADH-quinone oxidoreductase subunit C|nr:NADH-quinone oxidoreductase subunit C [Anaerolineae bacterium]